MPQGVLGLALFAHDPRRVVRIAVPHSGFRATLRKAAPRESAVTEEPKL